MQARIREISFEELIAVVFRFNFANEFSPS